MMLSTTPFLPPDNDRPIITYEELFPATIDQFLQVFSDKLDLKKIGNGGMPLNFELKNGHIANHRLSPILNLATPGHATDLVAICKEVYEDSYPYREMMDAPTVEAMLKSPHHHFILFKNAHGDIMGSFRCALDFENKKGYMGGFMLRKRYQKIVDVVKAIAGSYVWMWNTFSDEILVWYCENRTAHSTSQYMTAVCGIKTVGILPNKDIFYGIVESDVLGVIYREKALSEMRAPQQPLLIPAVLPCFFHAKKLYPLGSYAITPPMKIKLDTGKVQDLAAQVVKATHFDSFGYETLTLSFPHSGSYFSILHTTHLQNLEKAAYQVESAEEFYVFVKTLRDLMTTRRIRYAEIFVSAYRPELQTVLYRLGFAPRGYVPCWTYHAKTGFFEDAVLFNWYHGTVSNMRLGKEGKELLSTIRLDPH